MYLMESTQKVKVLFDGIQETLVWSCLDKIMGAVYADDPQQPNSAMAILGCFCFFAGVPNKALVMEKPAGCRQTFMIMVPENPQWAKLIEEGYSEKAVKVTRYAIQKEPHVWNLEKLKHIAASLDADYELKLIDEAIFHVSKDYEWTRDWTSQFPDYESYKKRGLGVVILKNGLPVSGASSYSYYAKGIEIEINTNPDYRRRGLALICAAKLILECEKRGLYPSWDAQNMGSVALAEKLGYHYSHDYTAYEIRDY